MLKALLSALGKSRQADTTDPRFPKDWCVFALLYCCVWSDGVLKPEEEAEVDALLTRCRSFIPLSPENVDVYVQQFKEQLAGLNSVYSLVDLACEKLPREPGLAEAIYAHCLDLVLSDRRVIDVEEEFLAHVADALALKQQARDEITQVLRWKHGY